MDALTKLSGDAQTFREKVWAHAIHIHRSDPSEFADLLSFDDVDRLLMSSGLRTPAVRLARDGTVLPSSAYTRSSRIGGAPVTGLVDARKILDLFNAGATVILQGLHRYWPPAARLVAQLEQSLGHPCQVNAYLTPAGAQGFARHCDTHDVFVVQTYGDKQWEVSDDGGTHQVLMQPGMCLYLPTGTPHSARAQDDPSLHVTVGINRIMWSDVLARAVRQLLAAGALDEPLPAGYHHDAGAFGRAVERRLADLRDGLADLDAERLVAAETARFSTSRGSLLDGSLLDRVRVATLGDDTPVRRRAGSLLAVVPDGERLRVMLGDRELSVPHRLQSPLGYLRDHPELTPSDLSPWLDPESRLVFVRRLVTEGLLEVAR